MPINAGVSTRLAGDADETASHLPRCDDASRGDNSDNEDDDERQISHSIALAPATCTVGYRFFGDFSFCSYYELIGLFSYGLGYLSPADLGCSLFSVGLRIT